MLPLLKFAGDGANHTLRSAVQALADEFHLTAAEREELLPSGQQWTFNNRVGWARTYMKKAELLDSPRRGEFCITARSKNVLAEKVARIDVSLVGEANFGEQFHCKCAR